MFESGVTANELINDIIEETDIAIPISNKQYIHWLNSVEQMLYSEIIKEQRRIEKQNIDNEYIIDLIALTPSDCDTFRFEDVYAFYADKTQFMKTTENSGAVFGNSYYKHENDLKYHPLKEVKAVEIIFIVRPKLKTVNDKDEIQDGSIKIPIEFLDLIKSRLRAEAYKIANEDTLAAKWINDYNVYVETFKTWIDGKAPKFGM